MITISELTEVLQEKLELKRKCIELENKYIETLAKFLKRDASVWTYSFKEDVEITMDNLEEYIGYSVWTSNEHSKSDLLKAVRRLYNEKFNSR